MGKYLILGFVFMWRVSKLRWSRLENIAIKIWLKLLELRIKFYIKFMIFLLISSRLFFGRSF